MWKQDGQQNDMLQNDRKWKEKEENDNYITNSKSKSSCCSSVNPTVHCLKVAYSFIIDYKQLGDSSFFLSLCFCFDSFGVKW